MRTGTVIDLKIQKGKIIARVQGTRKTPYRVEIRISPLTEQKCEAILDRCGKIETLERLLSGDFPDEMKELFQGEDGLFPQPSEISFQCSCPDWALMCKHVAAALYGVGARLDMNPALFFELRGIEIGRFVDVALANRVERMLENAQKPSARIMDDEEAAQKLFWRIWEGIAMGIYVNPGNEEFKRAANSKIYVDKTMLLAFTNQNLKSEHQNICVSRPRRFGKSMAANMLVAYYGKGMIPMNCLNPLNLQKILILKSI